MLFKINRFIDQAAEDISPTLWPGTAVERMKAVVESFPDTDASNLGVVRVGVLGIEFRLSAEAEQVDLSFPFLGEDRDALLALAEDPVVGPRLRETPAWQRILDLCAAWNDPDSLLGHHVHLLWLELDVEPEPTREAVSSLLPAPGVFVGFEPEKAADTDPETWQSILHDVLSALAGRAPRPHLVDALARCLKNLPEGAVVQYIGLMLSRGDEIVRLVFARLPASDVSSFLRAIGCRDDFSLPADLLAGDDAPTLSALQIDVGPDGIRARVGLEFAFDRSRQAKEGVVEKEFLQRLIDLGLCDAAKRDALLRLSCRHIGPMPAHQILLGHAGQLHHVKIIFDQEGAREAKAYYSQALEIRRAGEIEEMPPLRRRALFLQERAVTEVSPSQEQAAAVQERLEEWRRGSGLEDEDFRERLELAGLDEEAFRRLLAAREAEIPPRPRDVTAYAHALRWNRILGEIESGMYQDVVPHPVTWNNPDGTTSSVGPFGGFLEPFVRCAVGRLRQVLARLDEQEQQRGASPLIDREVEIRFVVDLTERLTKQCSSTLILELNIARLKGELEGETPSERFRYYSEKYFTPEKVLALLEEYSALARLMAWTAECWIEATTEFLRRLAADREALRSVLGSPLGTLKKVNLGVSDPHRGGRTVVIATDANEQKVVYKPTSLAVDVKMQGLIEAVNGFGLSHPQAVLKVLDRGDQAGAYGWREFVEAGPCREEEQLRRFYFRQGSWIALLHLVRGADVHYENLVARGEYPVLIDHETLFQHVAPWAHQGEGALVEASLEMHRSIVRQALLPHVVRLTGDGRGVDSSGLGGAGGQVAPGSVRRWADPGTDQMRVVEADYVLSESQNRPSLQGKPVDATVYLAEIVEGFRETWNLLAEHREEVHGLLDDFAGCEVRYLLRSTRVYVVFLRESRHPNDLYDGLDREQLLDRLWAMVPHRPEMKPVVPYEVSDLRDGDVPFFGARPESKDLWSSGGRQIENFFAEASLTEAHRLLDGFDDKARERQELLIRLTLSEAHARNSPTPPTSTTVEESIREQSVREEGGAPLRRASLIEASRHVGEMLLRRSLDGESGSCWITLDPFVDDRPGEDRLRNLAVTRSDLYQGISGISLYFAYLGELTGDERTTAAARNGLKTVREALALRGPGMNRALGAFLGRTSYSYLLLHLASLWSQPDLLEEALGDLPEIEKLIPDDEQLDLLTGSAGAVIVLLRLHAATGDPAALDVARACGEHLLAKARQTEDGLDWIVNSFSEPVAGFSHGAAGIAWSLAELARATGEERFLDAARRAVVAERRLLADPESSPFHTRTAWCHGRPSVALGRILTAPLLADASSEGLSFEDEIRAGAERILQFGRPADACLCHGALGNAEILAASARHCGVDTWQSTAEEWAMQTARSVESLENDLLLPLHGRFAGLFCGLAGIGWGLLRFADPQRVPSVLSLEPPR